MRANELLALFFRSEYKRAGYLMQTSTFKKPPQLYAIGKFYHNSITGESGLTDVIFRGDKKELILFLTQN